MNVLRQVLFILALRISIVMAVQASMFSISQAIIAPLRLEVASSLML